MVRHISSGSVFEAEIGYSRAVIDGDMIYVSGTTGYDYTTMKLPAGAGAQTRACLTTIAGVLEEAGSSFDDVVRVRIYLRDGADLAEIKPILRAAISATKPAATLVIAPLIEDEMKIEIEVTARIGAGASWQKNSQ
ncbi:MAG: RidA family protein [Alphaproteobacteria bacterium]|nr:RidA family protein [Alphaproteobacteria bacterium]